MKKKLQLLLILLLTYGFVCCPAFAGLSFAETTGRDRTFQTFFQNAFDSIVTTMQFIGENMSTWVQELSLPTSIEEIQANRDTIKGIRDQVSEKMGRPWIDRPTRD